jgi:hypothetical protein
MLQSDMKIKGFNGHITQTKVGTERWRIHNDGGRRHNIILPNTYHSAHAESRLLSPQHWLKSPKMVKELHALHTMMQSFWNGIIRSLRGPYQSVNVGIINTPAGIFNHASHVVMMKLANKMLP